LGSHSIGHSKQKVHMYMCPIPNGFWHRAISLYISKIVDKKEILRTVSIIGIYCSGDIVGTVYIFANSAVNFALCNSCEDMGCCSYVQWRVYCTVTFGEPFGIGHMHFFA
jgi:hypothetical protein